MGALMNQIYQRLKEQLHKEDLRYDGISARELYIVRLIARGFVPKEIADYLSLSEKTIQTHIKNVYKAIGVHKQTELVSWYYRKLFNGDGR
jgi:DNA-binding NarL/FixJ family response regulator